MTNELVRKSNYLNQFTCYKSTPQLKIFSILLSEIKKNPNQEVYTLYIQDIFKEFGGSQENYNQLKNICKQMMKIIDIPKERGFCLTALFYKINTEEKGTIEFTVNPELIPQLLVLSEFTSYYLKNIMHLKSAYSIRIYELLKQYASKENSGWWKVSIDDLRDILGIDKKQYKLYADFKRKVILVAQRELQETTDTAFAIEEHKRGRRVEMITFHIKDNTNKQAQIEEQKNYSLATTTLIRFGIPKQKALELYEKKGEEVLTAILNKWVKYLENEKMPDGSQIKSTKATLLWAIDNEDQETEFEKEKREELQKQQERQNEDLKRRNEEIHKALEEQKEKEKQEQLAKEEYASTSPSVITAWIVEQLQEKNESYHKLSNENKKKLEQIIFQEKENHNIKGKLYLKAVMICLELGKQQEQEQKREKQTEINTQGIASLKSVIQKSFLKEEKTMKRKKK